MIDTKIVVLFDALLSKYKLNQNFFVIIVQRIFHVFVLSSLTTIILDHRNKL